jgi:hypothetical protein
MRIIFLLGFLFFMINSLSAQFILSDDEERTTFLNTPSSLSLSTDEKFSLSVNNIVDARSKLTSFLWGVNYKGGIADDESFIFKEGDFVFSSEANAFVGLSFRLDRGSKYLNIMIDEQKESTSYKDLAQKYNSIYNSFIKSVVWDSKSLRNFNQRFLGKSTVKKNKSGNYMPFDEENAVTFISDPIQIFFRKVEELDYNSQNNFGDYRKHLSTSKKLKLSQTKINIIRNEFLVKVHKIDLSKSKAGDDIFELFKPIIKVFSKDQAKLNELIKYFEIDVKNKTVKDIANYKNMKTKNINELNDDIYFDYFLNTGFSYDDVLRLRDKFYHKVVESKLDDIKIKSKLSDSNLQQQLKIEKLEKNTGIIRGTAFFRSGIFGNEFRRIDTTVSSSMLKDSMVFIDEKYKGDFFELGFNMSFSGKHFIGISYKWDVSNNFDDLSKKTFSVLKTDTISGIPYRSEKTKTAYSGNYFDQRRQVFSLDYAYLINLNESKDSPILITFNPYFRQYFNKSDNLENEATFGLGINFYKKNNKFLFGLFIQKNDVFNKNVKEDEKFNDTINFGLRAAYSFSQLSSFVN